MANRNSNIEVQERTKEGRKRFVLRLPVNLETEQGVDPRNGRGGPEMAAVTDLLFTAEAIFWFLEQTADAVECGHDYFTKSELTTQMVFVTRLGRALTTAAYRYLDDAESAVGKTKGGPA